MVQTAQKLEAEGRRVAMIDLSSLGSQFVDAKWYLSLLQMINDALALMSDMRSWWEQQAHLSGTLRLVNFFKEVVTLSQTPIVIFLDEIDSTFSLPVTSDFFAAIRALYNARTQVPALERLTFVLVGVAAPGDLINDPKRTPFNIGQRVELTDFTLKEATPLGEGLGLPTEQAQQLLADVLKWTSGHPYLTQRLCVALLKEPKQISLDDTEKREAQVERIVARTFFGSKSEEDNHLQFVRDMLTKRAPDQIAVLSTYRDIRQGRTVRHEPQSVIQSHLKLSGIVWRDAAHNKLRVRNPIYEEVFDQKWIKEHWPLNWWQTLPRSVKIASGMMAVMFVALLFISVFAINQQQLASERAESEAIARAEAEEAARQESLARAEAESQTGLAQYEASEAKAAQAFLELSRDNLNQALLLARASVFYQNYSIEASRALRQTVEKTKLVNKKMSISLHDLGLRSAAWSPDGQWLLTNHWDRIPRIWNATTGELLLFLEELSLHWQATWSPDGQQVLAIDDGKARIWSREGQLLKSFDEVESSKSVMWGSNGQQVVIYTGNGEVQIWSIKGQLLQTLKGVPIVLSPDGQRIVMSPFIDYRRVPEAWDLVSMEVWDVPTGQQLYTRAAVRSELSLAAWSPDGARLLVKNRDNIQILEGATGQLLTTLEQDSSPVSSVAWSPDGLRILTGHQNGRVRIWSDKGQLLFSFTAHVTEILEVAWHPDGQQLLTYSRNDSTVRIWDPTKDLLENYDSI